MFILGVGLGVIMTISAIMIMMKAIPPKPPDDIITGQQWFITGLGRVEITKVLNSGNFKEYGYGVNIQYIMANGNHGHCTGTTLKEHGRIIPKEISTNDLLSKEAINSVLRSRASKISDVTYTYDKTGKTRVINAVYKDIV
jgi:hypothetical protein